MSGLCAILAFLIASCQQSSETLKPQTAVEGLKVSVVNGRIALASEQDFLKTIETLRKMSEAERVA